MKKAILILICAASLGASQAQVKSKQVNHAPSKQTTAKQAASKPATASQPVVAVTQPAAKQQTVALAETKPIQERPVQKRVQPTQQVARHMPVKHSDPFTFGVKAGMNIANVGGPDAGGFSAKVGFNIGGFVNIPVAEGISIQPELMFSQQGAKVRGYDGYGGGVDVKYNLSYLNVPVMARYTSSLGIYGETGPQLGFLLSAKEKAGSDKVDIGSNMSKVDFAWAFGVGYMTQSNVGFNARFNLGLSKLDSYGGSRIRNNVFQVGVVYKIDR